MTFFKIIAPFLKIENLILVKIGTLKQRQNFHGENSIIFSSTKNVMKNVLSALELTEMFCPGVLHITLAISTYRYKEKG